MLEGEAKEKISSAITRAQLELEEALSELDAMPAYDPGAVAFTAHALNNYLTIAGGTADLLMAHLRDDPDPDVRRWLESLQHVTSLMIRSVGQLIATAPGKESKFRFAKEDFTALIGRVCQYYERVAEKKHIRIVTNFSDDVPLIWIDRIVVAAVLDNLMSNAVKFSPLGKQIEVRGSGEEGWAVCKVCDQGPGISKEEQRKLFQKGVTLTPKPTGGESSMGYGLAVAKELIERMGGKIWCESGGLGQGACFAIRIPAYQGQTEG